MDLWIPFSETPITLENCPQRPRSLLSHIAELQWSKQGYKWLLLTAFSCTLHSLCLTPPPNTQKTAIKPLLCVYDGFRCAATPAFGAHGFHGWDSQRSVMNIHVWSVAGKIPGETERAGKMNIELTCWAGRGLHSLLPSHNVLCC